MPSREGASITWVHVERWNHSISEAVTLLGELAMRVALRSKNFFLFLEAMRERADNSAGDIFRSRSTTETMYLAWNMSGGPEYANQSQPNLSPEVRKSPDCHNAAWHALVSGQISTDKAGLDIMYGSIGQKSRRKLIRQRNLSRVAGTYFAISSARSTSWPYCWAISAWRLTQWLSMLLLLPGTLNFLISKSRCFVFQGPG